LYFDPQQSGPTFLDFRERAPKAATPQAYELNGRPQPQWLTQGWKAMGVPGTISGLFELHDKAGSRPMKTLLAPAEKLAREGFRVDAVLAERLREQAAKLKADPEAARIFYPGEAAPRMGERLKQKNLAKTLQSLQKNGAAAFYGPKATAKWREALQARGALLKPEDFQAYRTQWRQPLRGAYRQYEMVSSPPPSSGGGVVLGA